MKLLPYRIKEFNELFVGGFDTNKQHNIDYLVDVLEKYSNGLNDTFFTGNVSREYIINFEWLKDFAIMYPNLSYARFLSTENIGHISYFYSDSIRCYENYERIRIKNVMNHYDNLK